MVPHAHRIRALRALFGLGLAVALWAGATTALAQRLTDEEYRQAVAQLRNDSADARATAIDLLSRRAWNRRRELATDLRRLLREDPDWRVRASAGRAIGRLSLREAVPDLVHALRDTQVDVRVVAAAALWRLPDAAAVPALVELLADRDPNARQWGALALGVARDSRACAPLIRLLNDSAQAVRLDAIRSLGRIGDPQAVDPLVQTVQNERRDLEERAEAVSALAQLQGPAKVNALVRLLTIDDAQVRLRVVQALAQVGDALVIPALRNRRAAESRELRTAIDEAIQAIEERAREATPATNPT